MRQNRPRFVFWFALIGLCTSLTLGGCDSGSSKGTDLDNDGISKIRDCDDLDPAVGRPAEGCATGQSCRRDNDCASGLCDLSTPVFGGGGVCGAPSCEDERKNGSETDVDCGGECPIACQPEQSCTSDEDCSTMRCVNAVCGAACDNPRFAGAECDRCANPIFEGANCDECVDSRFTGDFCTECADPRFTGNNCEFCANDRFTGNNCDECIDRFTGEDCDQCSDRRRTGPECEECAEGFTGTFCDECTNPRATGEFCDECVAGFTGPACDECADPRFGGVDCDVCAPGFTGRGCTDCSDHRYTGELCDVCAPGYEGPDCQDCVDQRYTGDYCNECADPRLQGPECDQCVDPRRTGPTCERCAPRFQGENCRECADSYTGANCEHYRFDGLTGGGDISCGYFNTGSYICWGGIFLRIRGPVGVYGPTVRTNQGLACGLTRAGRAVCASSANAFGQRNPPQDVEFTTLAIGRRRPGFDLDPGGHGCGLDAEGIPHCWGLNDHGQTDVPEGLVLESIAAGVTVSAGLDAEGTLHTWGQSPGFDVPRSFEMYHGRRGRDDSVRRNANNRYTSLSIGRYHTCAIKTDDTLACWGDNYFRQSAPPEGTYTKVVSGWLHSCALSTGGAIRCWGKCTTSLRDASCDPAPGDYIDITGGDVQTCGLRRDGTTVCWGDGASRIPQPN